MEWGLLHTVFADHAPTEIDQKKKEKEEMASTRLSRRVSAAIGGAAIFAMIGFTAACSSDSDKPAEETTTTTTTTSEAPLSPTEKSLNPGGGVFTPPVTAPQPTFDPQHND